jgi:hypothetical protein
MHDLHDQIVELLVDYDACPDMAYLLLLGVLTSVMKGKGAADADIISCAIPTLSALLDDYRDADMEDAPRLN